MEQKHIINKQILEVQLPRTVDAFAVQKKLSTLCREQLMTIIDQVLSERGTTAQQSLQIDRLTIDLGAVSLAQLPMVFAEKFKEELLEVQMQHTTPDVLEEKINEIEKTPLRIVSHYLATGILPWWAGDMTKYFLVEQLALLLKKPATAFKQLLVQLSFNSTYLERFLHTFTEKQFLESLQVLSNISIENLSLVKKQVHTILKKDLDQKGTVTTAVKIDTIFWKVAFHQIVIAKDLKDLKKQCVQQLLLELGSIEKTKNPKIHILHLIRLLVEKHKKRYPNDRMWQQFFKQVSNVVNNPFFHELALDLLKEFRQLLINIESIRKKSAQSVDTKTVLHPIASYLQLLQTIMHQLQPASESLLIKQLQTDFEDTDFITVHNAGLILLWPFLQQFFENLGLIEDKHFLDEAARHKAICALHYLCDPDDATLFEGALPLNKIVCGIALEATVAPIILSTEEKGMAENLLQAVIQRGPHWVNLSAAGFRASYLRRQASLRTQDGHWLLQVQKETYDITLEKLPWSINIVKLPWMNKLLQIVWN